MSSRTSSQAVASARAQLVGAQNHLAMSLERLYATARARDHLSRSTQHKITGIVDACEAVKSSVDKLILTDANWTIKPEVDN